MRYVLEINKEDAATVLRMCKRNISYDIFLAEDVSQEILIKLWLYAEFVSMPLLKMMYKQVYLTMKRDGKIPDTSSDSDMLPLTAVDEGLFAVYDEYRDTCLFEVIDKGIKLLDREKAALELMQKQEYSLLYAARLVAMSDKQVKKFRKKLKKVLTKHLSA